MRLLPGLLALFVCSALAAEPLRVVSLAPSMSEIMLELQADDLLVGVLDGGERPAALRALPSVGRQGQLDLERLLSLRPDLLLLWPGSVPPAQRDQLKRLGIATYSAEPHDIDQLIEQIEAIAERIGRAEQGHRYAQALRDRLRQLRQQYRRDEPCRCSTRSGTDRCIRSVAGRWSAMPWPFAARVMSSPISPSRRRR